MPRAWLRCLKPLGRAMTKALACYDGDASRVLDVCRARAVFAAVPDLAACLRRILAAAAPPPPGGGGGGVRIRRIRSSMRPGFEEALAGGFRVP